MTYKKINAIIRECCLDKVREALVAAGAAGLTVTHVRGAGEYANTFGRDNLSRHARLEVFAEEENVERLVQAIHGAAHTGQRGDGVVAVRWTFPEGELGLALNLGDGSRPLPDLPGEPIFRYPAQAPGSSLASSSVVVTATARGQA